MDGHLEMIIIMIAVVCVCKRERELVLEASKRLCCAGIWRWLVWKAMLGNIQGAERVSELPESG